MHLTGYWIRGDARPQTTSMRTLATAFFVTSFALALSVPLEDESGTDHRAHAKPGDPVNIVDWDGDGEEVVTFDASESHSHFFNSKLKLSFHSPQMPGFLFRAAHSPWLPTIFSLHGDLQVDRPSSMGILWSMFGLQKRLVTFFLAARIR